MFAKTSGHRSLRIHLWPFRFPHLRQLVEFDATAQLLLANVKLLEKKEACRYGRANGRKSGLHQSWKTQNLSALMLVATCSL